MQYISLPPVGFCYGVNEKYFKQWGQAMAYVLGFLYADGSLENSPATRGKYVRVSGTEIEILAKIRKSLQAQHPFSIREKDGPRKKQYLLRIGSRALYESLEKLGLEPRKSLTMRFPAVPASYLGSFLRGYFDGDGCVFLETRKGSKGQEVIKKLSVIFTSGSKNFLENLHKNLVKWYNFLPRKVYKSRRSFQLRYNTQESLKLYKILYKKVEQKLFLKRKQDIFKKYIALKRPRGEVANTAVCKTAIHGCNSRRGL